MATQASTTGGCSTDTKMDPTIWGELQHHIDMAKQIFAKLVFREFFQMRLVCKAWNRPASDEAFLLESFPDPIPKPFFVIINDSVRNLLTYDAPSRHWNWSPLPSLEHRCGHIAMDGLVYTYNVDSPCRRDQSILNLHTRALRKVPPLDLDPMHPLHLHLVFGGMAVAGMAVDTSVRPCAFELVQGLTVYTQTFNSSRNSWTLRQSQNFGPTWERRASLATTCAHCNGFVYTTVPVCLSKSPDVFDPSVHDSKVVSYDLERGVWAILDDCSKGVFREKAFTELISQEETWREWSRNSADHGYECNVGAWDGLVVNVMVVGWQGCVVVWELSGQFQETDQWTVLDRMPEELFIWLTAKYEEDGDDDDGGDDPSWLESVTKSISFTTCVYTSFCDEFVLVYNWLQWCRVPERYVMLNLDTKFWEKFERPVEVESEAFVPVCRDGDSQMIPGRAALPPFAVKSVEEKLLLSD